MPSPSFDDVIGSPLRRHRRASAQGRRRIRRPGAPAAARLRWARVGAASVAAFALGAAGAAALDLRLPGGGSFVHDAGLAGAVVETGGTSTDEDHAGLAELRVDAGTSRTAQRLSLSDTFAEPVPGAVDPLLETRVVPAGLTAADLDDGLLRAEVLPAGSGELVVVPGSSPAASAGGSGAVRTVRVEVEAGLAVDGEVFSARVMEILTAPGGWTTTGEIAFARTDGPADIAVVLASPATTDALCAPLRTAGQYSCGRDGRAVLNMLRWVEGQGKDEFPDRSAYREYLVNHEVGHLLGHRHRSCGGAGTLAPLMQQQSYSSAPCVPNGWPYPDAR